MDSAVHLGTGDPFDGISNRSVGRVVVIAARWAEPEPTTSSEGEPSRSGPQPCVRSLKVVVRCGIDCGGIATCTFLPPARTWQRVVPIGRHPGHVLPPARTWQGAPGPKLVGRHQRDEARQPISAQKFPTAHRLSGTPPSRNRVSSLVPSVGAGGVGYLTTATTHVFSLGHFNLVKTGRRLGGSSCRCQRRPSRPSVRVSVSTRRSRISPMVRSRLMASRRGRCVWIW